MATSALGWLVRLGAAGATRNAALALEQQRRDEWVVAALEARLGAAAPPWDGNAGEAFEADALRRA